ncbi:MAG: linoleoyl-CoA desaturase, partial [Limisphaerales bacterium]
KLQKLGGSTIWIEAIIALTLYLTPIILVYAGLVTSVWMSLGLGLVMGTGFLMVGADIMHSANHGTFSSNKKINKFFSYSMELLGMSSRNWKVQHNDLHHMHTNIVGEGGDGDLATGEPILKYSLFSKLTGGLYKHQHKYVWFLYSLAFVMWITNKDFRMLPIYYKEGRYRFRKGQEMTKGALYRELIFNKLLYYSFFFIIPIAVLGTPFYIIFVMWLTSAMLAGAIMMPVFQMAHTVDKIHQYDERAIDVSWMNHQIRTSADVRLSNPATHWIFTHLVGGLNYQKVHHVFRGISHTHYPALSKIVNDLVAKHNIESHTFTSLRSAIASHYRMMRIIGSSKGEGSVHLH